MQIINLNANLFLARMNSTYYCAGYMTGPIRIIGGIVQMALNAIAALFLCLPSTLGCINRDSALHVSHMLSDGKVGFLHIVRGAVEFFPGSTYCLDMFVDGRGKILLSDHPFSPFYIEG